MNGFFDLSINVFDYVDAVPNRSFDVIKLVYTGSYSEITKIFTKIVTKMIHVR